MKSQGLVGAVGSHCLFVRFSVFRLLFFVVSPSVMLCLHYYTAALEKQEAFCSVFASLLAVPLRGPAPRDAPASCAEWDGDPGGSWGNEEEQSLSQALGVWA